MNEFTKEELNVIAASLATICSFYKCEKTAALALKILSLIDNYCEHKNTRNGDPVQECIDCGKHI